MHRIVEVSVDAMIEDLRKLVEIESPSRDRDALAASAKVVAALIESRLGGQAVLVESEAGPHVHWSAGDDPQVLILGHHDTVFPLGTLERRPFTVEDGHATGPGSSTCSAGWSRPFTVWRRSMTCRASRSW